MKRVTPLMLAFALIAGAIATYVLQATASAAAPSPVACDATKGACWKPALNARWQYQLQGVTAYASTGYINVNVSAVPYTRWRSREAVCLRHRPVSGPVARWEQLDDQQRRRDRHPRSGRESALLHQRGLVGELATGRECVFPASVLGSKNGWPGEKWLDIRQTSVLLPIMESRVQKCVTVVTTGSSGTTSTATRTGTGFLSRLPIRSTTIRSCEPRAQVRLDGRAEERRRARRTSPPISTMPSTSSVSSTNECTNYTTYFVANSKAVFQVEHMGSTSKFCPAANAANRNAILKSVNLFDTPYTPCR